MASTRKSWLDFPIAQPLLRALKEQKFSIPLPIQARTLRATLILDKHVFGAARTGSGKTIAYAIPVLNKILSKKYEPSSKLKERLCKKQKKKEDFELIDGQMCAIEDMIVDKLSNDDGSKLDEESSDLGSDVEAKTYTCPEAIILVPTRELAFQVQSEIEKLCKYTKITSCCLIGGLSQDKQLRKLNKTLPQVIIATPGRLYDIVQSDTVEHLNVQSVASIRTLVIDEADRMVQKGHFEELMKILDILKESKGFRDESFQYRVYLFSATLTFLHELPERFKANPLAIKESRTQNSKKSKEKKVIDPKEHNKRNKMKNLLQLLGIDRADTKIIDLNDESSFGRPSSDQLTEMRLNCVAQEKDLYLYYFLVQNKDKRVLVFCNSKDCLRRLSNVLKYLGFDTLKLFADMDQKKRLSNLEKFRQRPNAVLIATDVAARGLDVKELDCVVHYQVPKTCESYIHRSGRTARLSRKGVSLTLCEPKEAPFYRRLCNNINNGNDLDTYDIDVHLRALMKDRVAIAQQCDKIDHRLRESKSDRNWFSKAAKDCEIELDEEELRKLSGRGNSQQKNIEEEAGLRRKLSQLEKQLKVLLKKPLITRESLMKQSVDRMQASVANDASDFDATD